MEPPSADWFRPKDREPASESISFRPPKARQERRQRDQAPKDQDEMAADQWFRAKARERRAEKVGYGGPPPREVSDRRLMIALLVFGVIVVVAMILYASRAVM